MLGIEHLAMTTADLSLLLAAGVLAWPVAVIAFVLAEIASHLRRPSP